MLLLFVVFIERIRKEDKIDNSVGIVFEKKAGKTVKQGDIIAYIHADDEKKAKQAVEKLEEVAIIK